MFTKKVFSRLVSFLFVAVLLLAQTGPVYATDTGTVSGAATMSDLAEPYQAPYYLKASPADEWVHARGWLEGTPLDLTIRNAADTLSYSTSAVVAQAPWNPNGPDDQVAIFELASDWDVQVGDVVTVTDSIEEETLTVVDTTQLHWLSGNDNTEGVTAQQDAAHSYNLANPEIELLFIVGRLGENTDYAPDIVGPLGVFSGNEFKGEWLDLGPLITASGYDTSQFSPELMAFYYNADEGQYGLPFTVFPIGLYYQKSMFDSAGLNYPPANYGDNYVLDSVPVEWNIATLNEVAKRLTLDNVGKNATDPDFDPNNIVQYGYVPQWQSSTAIASLWGADTMLGGTPGAYTASIPDQWSLAWKAYYNGIWGQQPFIPNGSAINSPEFGQGNPFNSGKVAMATVQSWYLCCIGDAGTNWELGTAPSYAGTVNGVFHADGFRIFKNTLHELEAFDALIYLTDDTTLIEAFDQMPARTSAQAAFLAGKESQFPFVDNWYLLQDGLNYIDDPHHESWMPNLAMAWERLSQFQDRLINYSSLDMDNEIELLRWGLERIFNTGVNPGYPLFSVRANDDRVEGWEWPNGATVTIEIERDGTIQITKTAVVGPAPWNPDEIRFEYNFGGEFDIQVDDVITVTDGTTTKSTIVSVHSITEIDVDTDIAYGVSDPDVRVDVWACDDYGCYNRHAITDDISGGWQVDFSVAGFDVVPGTWVDSEQTDNDGDSTRFGISVPNPSFSARRAENEVHGYQWPLGVEVTLTIDDPNTPEPIDYTKMLIVGAADWNPNETFVQFRLWEDEFTFASGMTVTMSDGTTQKTHLVTSLTVTDVSPANDTISGTALPDSQVDVGHIYCDESGCYGFRRASANLDGNWQVDFSQPGAEPDEQDIIDIVPGMGNEARQCDEDGDCTQYGWNAPNPRFDAWYLDGHISAYDWSLGTVLTLEIDDPDVAGNPDYSTTTTVGIAPWDSNQTSGEFNLNGAFDIQPGMILTVSGASLTKTLVIADLAVTNIDLTADTVAGTAGSQQQLWMYLDNSSGNCCRNFQADIGGAWLLDYSQPGSEGQQTEDIAPGSAGTVNAPDGDGDNTSVNWNVPNPHFGVRANDDRVEGWDWPNGATVTIEIERDGTLEITRTAVVGPAPWNPDEIRFDYNFGGEFDIQVGDVVTVTHEGTTKSTIVTRHSITRINITTDIVYGVSDPDVRIDVWACDGNGCYNRHAITDDVSGEWQVDFSQPGSEPHEEDVINIVPGTWVDSEQRDQDGDKTMFGTDAPTGIGKTAPADSAIDVSISPTLSWSASDDATSYEYCYSSVAGPCTQWHSVGMNTSVTLNGLAPDYIYYWQIRASGITEADAGVWWSFTTTDTPPVAWPPYTPPAAATFNDVPMTASYWDWVERLVNSAITAGCGNGNYCPTQSVTRAQMAIFLLRAKYGSDYNPPPVGESTGFDDVPVSASYAPWVKQLAAEGITGGCGGGNYCPFQAVNRAQMAIFLLRGRHGSTYSPPAVGDSSGFADVPSTASYATWVKQLAAESITGGCGNGNYCPFQSVNRAQMAIFLVRNFELP